MAGHKMGQRQERVAVLRRRLIFALRGKCSCSGCGCWHEGPCQVKDERVFRFVWPDSLSDRRRREHWGEAHLLRHCLANLDWPGMTVGLLCANCQAVAAAPGGVDSGENDGENGGKNGSENGLSDSDTNCVAVSGGLYKMRGL